MELALRYAHELPDPVRREFENMVSALQAWSAENHKSDGKHGNIDSNGNVIATGYGTFAGQHRCLLYKSAAQAIANGATDLLTWDQPINNEGFVDVGYVIGSIFYAAGDNKYVYVRESGLYLVTASVTWTPTAGGKREIALFYDALGDVTRVTEAGSTTANVLVTSMVLPMRAGERVGVTAHQDSGGAVNVSSVQQGTWFQVTKIG